MPSSTSSPSTTKFRGFHRFARRETALALGLCALLLLPLIGINRMRRTVYSIFPVLQTRANRALQRAAQQGDNKGVERLLDAGADVNASDDSSMPPLYIAMMAKHFDIAKLLLHRGASTSFDGLNTGFTALAHAVAFGRDASLVRVLLEHGADPNEQDHMNRTALMWATEHRQTKVAELLLKHGAKVNAQDEDGDTALSEACSRGRLETAKLLLRHGANPNLARRDHFTPLNAALDIASSPNRIARLLLEHGAKLDIKGTRHEPLLRAVMNGDPVVIKALLDMGLNASTKDQYGKTALMQAANQGNIAVVRLLLAHGADPNARETDGWTVLTNAKGSDLDEPSKTRLIQLLRRAGARK